MTELNLGNSSLGDQPRQRTATSSRGTARSSRRPHAPATPREGAAWCRSPGPTAATPGGIAASWTQLYYVRHAELQNPLNPPNDIQVTLEATLSTYDPEREYVLRISRAGAGPEGLDVGRPDVIFFNHYLLELEPAQTGAHTVLDDLDFDAEE